MGKLNDVADGSTQVETAGLEQQRLESIELSFKREGAPSRDHEAILLSSARSLTSNLTHLRFMLALAVGAGRGDSVFLCCRGPRSLRRNLENALLTRDQQVGPISHVEIREFLFLKRMLVGLLFSEKHVDDLASVLLQLHESPQLFDWAVTDGSAIPDVSTLIRMVGLGGAMIDSRYISKLDYVLCTPQCRSNVMFRWRESRKVALRSIRSLVKKYDIAARIVVLGRKGGEKGVSP